MPTPANPTALAQQARRSYAERLLGGMPVIVQAIDQGARLLAAAVAEPAVALKRRELMPVLQGGFPDLAGRHGDAPARRAQDRHRHADAARRAADPRRLRQQQAEPGRRRHDRARDPELAPGAGDDGPGLLGVHRPAIAHEHAREPRRARRQRHPPAARAGAHRHQLLAGGAAHLRRLAAAAVGDPRGAVAVRRRGVSRDQSLPVAAPRPARGRPAPLHPAFEPRQRRGRCRAAAAASARRPACRRPAAPNSMPRGEAGPARRAKSARRRGS